MKKKQLKQRLDTAEKALFIIMEKYVRLLKFSADQLADDAYDDYLPCIEDVILNGPATVVKWDDGTKTVTKCREGDEYDPVFGILACTVRKLTRNRGHAVDACENPLKELAGCIAEPEDIDALIDFASLMHDSLRVLSDSTCVWMPQLGEDEQQTEEEQPSDAVEHVAKSIDELEREHDAVRQEVRNLIDAGEL